MRRRSFNYVRAYRLRWGLTARDFALLLGRDPSMITRLEREGKSLSGRAALACQVVFGVPPQTMFPALYEQVEDAVMARAAKLHEALEGRSDRRSVRRRELLADMMRRATDSSPAA